MRDKINSWRETPPFDGDPDYTPPSALVIDAALAVLAGFAEQPDSVAADRDGGIEFYWRDDMALRVVRVDERGGTKARTIPTPWAAQPAPVTAAEVDAAVARWRAGR